MQTERQAYADWLEHIRNRAYACTHALLPPCPVGMRSDKYDAIRRRLERLYAPMSAPYASFLGVFGRCSEELWRTFESGDARRRSELMMELSGCLDKEILEPYNARIADEEKKLISPVLERMLQIEIKKQEKRLGRKLIENTLIEAIPPHEDEYLVVFANGTAVGVTEYELAGPPADNLLEENAKARMDLSKVWQSFPKDGDPEVKPGEVKAFYTLNEPENLASYWAVVDGDLYAWLEENERTVEEVCTLFHSKDVREKRVLKVLKPSGKLSRRKKDNPEDFL